MRQADLVTITLQGDFVEHLKAVVRRAQECPKRAARNAANRRNLPRWCGSRWGRPSCAPARPAYCARPCLEGCSAGGGRLWSARFWPRGWNVCFSFGGAGTVRRARSCLRRRKVEPARPRWSPHPYLRMILRGEGWGSPAASIITWKIWVLSRMRVPGYH